MDFQHKFSLQSIKFWIKTNPWMATYYMTIFFGFIIRLIVSLQAWGMKHPDEIFQSLEMAHYLVYGTGYIPPEFQNSNITIPSYAAARSWLFPYIFAGLMYLGEFLGMKYLIGTLILIKIFMAFQATLLIPAVFKLTKQLTKEKETATIAAIAVAFWFRVIEYTVRTFTNTFFLPYVFYGMYRVFKSLDEDHVGIMDMISVGFLVGISTYIRIDMGIIVFSFFMVYFRINQVLHYTKFIFSSAIFWIIGAWIDYLQYDGVKFFSVPINWFTFNVIEGYSEIFGVSHPLFYVGSVLVADLLFPWLILILVWIIYYYTNKPEKSILNEPIGITFRKLFFTTALTWLIYSNAWPTISFDPFIITIPYSHKEVRFIIGGLVLFLITASVSTRLIASSLPRFISTTPSLPTDVFHLDNNKIRKYRNKALIYSLAVFLILSLFATSFRAHNDHHEGVNKSLIYVGHQENVSRIVIIENWYSTGFYTYSHQDNETRFRFLPFHVDYGASTADDARDEVRFARSNTYLIIPGIQYSFYKYHMDEDFRSVLQNNGWSMVYEYDTTETWYFHTN